MNIIKGKYKKKDDSERDIKLFVLKDTSYHLGGIDLTKLTKEEVEEFVNIQEEYEKQLERFLKKSYRTFIKENIVESHIAVLTSSKKEMGKDGENWLDTYKKL